VIRLKFSSRISALAQVFALASLPGAASAHAFPIRSEPRVGWTVDAAPAKVTIWFDGELEAAFSTITVYDVTKRQVDKRNCHVNDASVLEVDLTPLSPGVYRVYWKALSKDTHVTEGDFSFAISGKTR
jgi:methionine-rich copper-binding protein CopC